MELKNYNQASDLATRIGLESTYVKNLKGAAPDAAHLEKIKPFTVPELQEAFEELGQTQFTSAGLNLRLADYAENLYKLKNIIPNHTKIQLAFLPADINGRLYSDQEIANGDNCILFFSATELQSAPNSQSGSHSPLSYGLGGIGLSYHAKLLPPELQDRCSFVFDYMSDTPWADQKDFDLLKTKLSQALSNWQKTFSPNSPQPSPRSTTNTTPTPAPTPIPATPRLNPTATPQLDLEKNPSPLQTIFTAEINRIYQANSTKQTLQKIETTHADLSELQQIAAQIPAPALQLPDLTAEDLPNSFDLNNLTGQKISLAFIPLSDHGRSLTEMDQQEKQNFISNQTFLKTLSVDPTSQNLTSGFGQTKGFFYDLLPAELQADLSAGGTTFTIDQKFAHPEEARDWYAEKYNQAKNNLLKLLTPKPATASK